MPALEAHCPYGGFKKVRPLSLFPRNYTEHCDDGNKQHCYISCHIQECPGKFGVEEKDNNIFTIRMGKAKTITGKAC